MYTTHSSQKISRIGETTLAPEIPADFCKARRISNHFPFANRQFAILNIKTLTSLKNIQADFDHVPLDSYVEDKTRFKDIVRFRKEANSMLKTGHENLYHAINAGSYHGQVSRSYTEVPAEALDALEPVVEVFAKISELKEGEEALLQRQRVSCHTDASTRTVREGLHRDGVEKLALLCVRRQNVSGGISLVYDEVGDLIFAHQLEEGDMLFINDRTVFHDATAIKPLDNRDKAFRDILILTWPTCRENDLLDHVPYYGA